MVLVLGFLAAVTMTSISIMALCIARAADRHTELMRRAEPMIDASVKMMATTAQAFEAQTFGMPR